VLHFTKNYSSDWKYILVRINKPAKQQPKLPWGPLVWTSPVQSSITSLCTREAHHSCPILSVSDNFREPKQVQEILVLPHKVFLRSLLVTGWKIFFSNCLLTPPLCLFLLTPQTAGSVSSSIPPLTNTYMLCISLKTLQRLCLPNAETSSTETSV